MAEMKNAMLPPMMVLRLVAFVVLFWGTVGALVWWLR